MNILNIARTILNSNSLVAINLAADENTEENINFLGYEVCSSTHSNNSNTYFFSDGSILDNTNTIWRVL